MLLILLLSVKLLSLLLLLVDFLLLLPKELLLLLVDILLLLPKELLLLKGRFAWKDSGKRGFGGVTATRDDHAGKTAGLKHLRESHASAGGAAAAGA